MAGHSASDFAFSLISFHEQVLGAHSYLTRARSSADLVRGYLLLGEILVSFSAIQTVAFDAAAAATFDGLVAQRIRVAPMDLRIAAIALSRGLTLLTRNARDFSRVPGLSFQDWTV